MPLDAIIDFVKRHFVEFIETQFILNPDASSLDLLSYEEAKRYKDFKWKHFDYYGGKEGPNENRALAMVNALSRIRPERRPHTGATAVLTKSQFKLAIRRYIVSQLQPIPDFPPGSGYTQPKGEKLNQFALQDFLRMREAALRDRVPIIVRDSYRSPEVAARNAARAGNRTAVAEFSAHILGLAVDLNMGYKIGAASRKFTETSTRPMQNVVDMRKSPVHKWLFLRGQQYGWYPFQHEPWHWEYNPPGFQQKFLSNLKSL